MLEKEQILRRNTSKQLGFLEKLLLHASIQSSNMTDAGNSIKIAVAKRVEGIREAETNF